MRLVFALLLVSAGLNSLLIGPLCRAYDHKVKGRAVVVKSNGHPHDTYDHALEVRGSGSCDGVTSSGPNDTGTDLWV